MIARKVVTKKRPTSSNGLAKYRSEPEQRLRRYVAVDFDRLFGELENGGYSVSVGMIEKQLSWVLSRSTFRRMRRDGLIKQEFINPLYCAIANLVLGSPNALQRKKNLGSRNGTVTVSKHLAAPVDHERMDRNRNSQVRRAATIFINDMVFSTDTELGRLMSMNSEWLKAHRSRCSTTDGIENNDIEDAFVF